MLLPGGFHLTYCTNVHPGESWEETFAALQSHVPEVKARVCPDGPFGIGLRLSAAAARGLATPGCLPDFQAWLARRGCYVFTVNGFPYGAFHGTRVKEGAFEPDWSSPARQDYTCRLALLLADLLPDGMNGSISTVPLGYRQAFAGSDRSSRLDACATQLARLAALLAGLEATSGHCIRLGLEPEPDGAIETGEEFIAFLHGHLLPAARRQDGEAGEGWVRRHIGLCIDTCHASVVGEDVNGLLPMLARAAVPVVKLQVSAALRVDWRADGADIIRRRLAALADPVYLHQVRGNDGSTWPDLPPALAAAPSGEWRVHCHVPIDRPFFAGFASTHQDTSCLLRACVRGRHCRHLEIETYTWGVLPDAEGIDLHDAIAREFRWTLDQLV